MGLPRIESATRKVPTADTELLEVFRIAGGHQTCLMVHDSGDVFAWRLEPAQVDALVEALVAARPRVPS